MKIMPHFCVEVPRAVRLLVVGMGLSLWLSNNALAQLPDFTELVERNNAAVVNISTTSERRDSGQAPRVPGLNENDPLNDFFRRFVPPQPAPGQGPGPRQFESRSLGSGFIISADGYILTNAHVVSNADEINVKLNDKREFKAKVVGADPRTDVALLKVEASGLTSVRMGDANRLKVGEWVLAIGSPFGLENTVTAGIVSAKSRDTGDYLPFIQTDVAVNPGNSGGPLINTRGEVVGINSQIFSRSGGYMGISFAIPMDEAMRIAGQLKSSGKVSRGRIGVAIGEVSKELADSLGLSRVRGALVRNVEAGAPADRAGLEPGDIIVSFNEKSIEKSSDLPRIVGDTKPGSKVPLQVWRKGAQKDLSIQVADMDPPEKTVAKKNDADASVVAANNPLGVSVAELTDAKRREFSIKAGVEIIGLSDGPLSRVGARVGDVIVRIGDVDVTSVKQFDAAIKGLPKNKAIPIFIRRSDSTIVIPVKPGQ